MEGFRPGLEAPLRDERLSQTELASPEVEEVADALLARAGPLDYFDRLIYATAACRGSLLLTEDEELARVAERGDLPAPRRVVRWDEVARELGGELEAAAGERSAALGRGAHQSGGRRYERERARSSL